MAAGAIGVLILVLAFVVGIFVLIGTFGSWVAATAMAFLVISGFLMLVILVQQPKGGGLAGAFGGSGGSQGAVMGAKAGDMLTYATVVLFVLFLGSLLGLTAVIRHTHAGEVSTPDTAETSTDTPDDAAGGGFIPTDDAPADGTITIGDSQPDEGDAAVDGSTDADSDEGEDAETVLPDVDPVAPPTE